MIRADRLREAAKVLRERAEAAAVPPWSAAVHDDGWTQVLVGGGMDNLSLHGYPSTATYIATMHPGVGLALADWLDDEADEEQYGHDPHDFTRPHRLADLILGAES